MKTDTPNTSSCVPPASGRSFQPSRFRKTAATLAALGLTAALHAQTTPASGSTDEAVNLDEFVVKGYRSSLAQSLETKRASGAIVDVISAQDVGKFPDTNVAESLSHIPGVTVDRLFGEGERVAINGTDPNLNRTLLNGQAVASGDWFILDAPSRQFNFTLLAPEVVGRAEVYKTPEARLPEGSIGGTILIHTRNPLELGQDLTFAATLGDNYNDRAKKDGHNLSQAIGWRNKASTFGLMLGLQQSREHFRRDGVEALGFVKLSAQTAGTTLPAPAGSLNASNPNAIELNTINTPLFDQTRIRTGGNLGVSIKPTENLLIEATSLISKQQDDNANFSYYPFLGWGGGGVTTTGVIRNGVVDSGTVTNNIAVEDLFYRLATVKTEVYDLKATFKKDKWKISEQVGFTKATGGTQRQFYIEPAPAAGYSFTGALTAPGFSWTDPTLARTPQKWTLGGGWWNGNLAADPETDREKYAQIDAEYGLNANNNLRFGLRYTNHDTKQDWYILTVNTLPFTDLVAFGARLTPSNFLKGLPNTTADMRSHIIVNPKMVGDILAKLPYLAPGVTFDPAAAAGYYNGPIGGSALLSNGASSSTLPTLQQALDRGEGYQPAQSFAVSEQTKSAYVQDDFAYGEWSGNAGFRFVQTYTASSGALVTDTTTTGINFAHKYTDVLPAINAKYALSKDTDIRAGVSMVIARPNYADESPSLNLFNSILQGNGGNPNLKPYRATDFDLGYDWYFAKHSLLSVNAYYKSIKDYVLKVAGPEAQFNQATGRVDTFNISRPRNAGTAKSKGVSLYAQHDIWRGIGISGNYAYNKAEGVNGAELPGASKHQVNISPYFENKLFLARLTYAYRSDYFTGIDRGASNYTQAYTELDVNGAYNITKNIQITGAITNLLDEKYYSYAKQVPGVTGKLFQAEYKNGRRAQVAIHVNF